MDPRIDLNDAQVTAALRRLEAFGRAAGPAMAAAARYMKSSAQLRFRRQAGPDGQPWLPSRRVRKHGGQTLRLTSRLRNSITSRSGPDYAEAGTNVVYAAVHQFGESKRVTVRAHKRMRKGSDAARRRVSVRTGMVKTHVRMLSLPARPYLGFSDEDRMAIRDILLEALQTLKNG